MNFGIAVDDAATGTGYLMYSEGLLSNRFAANPLFSQTSTNLVAVRFSGGTWEYNDNYNWHSFVIQDYDRLLAEIDFDADSITSLAGTDGLINGMASGFTGSDLTFTADSWRGSSNDGEFEFSGTYFEV